LKIKNEETQQAAKNLNVYKYKFSEKQEEVIDFYFKKSVSSEKSEELKPDFKSCLK
jgi:hypothetical protein